MTNTDTVLTRALQGATDSLFRRVFRRRIARFRRLVEGSDSSESALAVRCVQLAEQSSHEIASWLGGLERLHHDALSADAQEQRALVGKFLDGHAGEGRGPWTLERAERWVLRGAHARRLDLELCLRLAGWLGCRLGESGWSPARLDSELGLPNTLLRYLARDKAWRVRVAALDCLRGLAAHGGLKPDIVHTLLMLAQDHQDQPWVQRAALRCLRCVDATVWWTVAARRLDDGRRRAGDDLFVRRAVVDALGSEKASRARPLLLKVLGAVSAWSSPAVAVPPVPGESAATAGVPGPAEANSVEPAVSGQGLRQAAAVEGVPDCSEHVRIGAARALVGLQDGQCCETLARLFGLTGGHSEPSHRVRTSALLAGVEAALAQQENDALLPVLRDCLRLPGQPIFSRALLEGLPGWVDRLSPAEHGMSPDVHALVSELDARINSDSLALPLIRLCEEAREAIVLPRDTSCRHVLHALQAALSACRPDQERIFDGPLDASPDCVGRVLAFLSRTGFGLYARPQARRLRVYREGQDVVRLWRILHELRRPRPDKRKDHLHSTARWFRGSLRAHPLLLGELARTEVPGERRFCEAEGQWRRYLPLVEDVLDLTSTRREIRLYSSPGITCLGPPRSLLARLRLRWRTTWHYARIAQLRDDAPGRYLQMLRDAGVTIRFVPHVYSYGGSERSALHPALAGLFAHPGGAP